MSDKLTLPSLISRYRGERNSAQLARDCGGRPTAMRINQYKSLPISAFPDADTIRGLSRGLGVSELEIILAASRSLGLNVEDTVPEDLSLAGAGLLPATSQQLLRGMSEELKRMNSLAASK